MADKVTKVNPTEDDYGFTFLHPDDIGPNEDLSKTIAAIWALIDPFLEKLEQDPQKAVLNWPNRYAVVHDIHSQLAKLCKKVLAIYVGMPSPIVNKNS